MKPQDLDQKKGNNVSIDFPHLLSTPQETKTPEDFFSEAET